MTMQNLIAELTVTPSGVCPAAADVLAVPVYADGTVPEGVPAELDHTYLALRGFEGKPGQIEALPAADGTVVLAVGIGEPGKLDGEGLRNAAGSVAKAAGKATHVAVAFDGLVDELDDVATSQAVAEGLLLGGYRFGGYHRTSEKKPGPGTFTVIGGDAQGVATGQVVAEAVIAARDLVNEPAEVIHPENLARWAGGLASNLGLDLDVWDEAELTRQRCGGILGVGRGSAHGPRFIQLTYSPSGRAKANVPTVVLVGKGITFDAGGLSIKPATSMMTMKDDMGGAAAVLCALGAIARLKLPVRVVAMVPAAENLLGPLAAKPGDVFRMRNGKTVENLNTDAEGRLVLADALSLASEMAPDLIVDVATLTGAALVALGDDIGGVMGSADDVVEEVLDAADRCGEPFWALPLPDRYRKHLDSDVADMKNIGKPGKAGTLVAGLFLSEFVDDVPWAHLDIAGPAFTDSTGGFQTKGGTGFAVRTLIELVRQRAAG